MKDYASWLFKNSLDRSEVTKSLLADGLVRRLRRQEGVFEGKTSSTLVRG